MRSIDTDIQMVDLKSQYLSIKDQIDQAVIETISSTAYINGPRVKQFEQELVDYHNINCVIPCANGTDALQIAIMALDLKPGDEVIVPAFTYVATAEVIGLLGLIPVMVDVDPDTFNITLSAIQKAVTPKTKLIVPVNLFGQCVDLESIVTFAKANNLYVIEDNAQSIGADFYKKDGTSVKSGTIGHISCTSFYPSKNLGCYGDGGAIFTNDEALGARIRMIANHGQSKRYYHSMIGVNSRLDSIQAAILSIKLKNLDKYCALRQKAAAYYTEALASCKELQVPKSESWSNHVYHQYTLKVPPKTRNNLQVYLKEQGIPSMIYYPVPLYKQGAFKEWVTDGFFLPVTEQLCECVISLPMHTELTDQQLAYISKHVLKFFEK